LRSWDFLCGAFSFFCTLSVFFLFWPSPREEFFPQPLFSEMNEVVSTTLFPASFVVSRILSKRCGRSPRSTTGFYLFFAALRLQKRSLLTYFPPHPMVQGQTTKPLLESHFYPGPPFSPPPPLSLKTPLPRKYFQRQADIHQPPSPLLLAFPSHPLPSSSPLSAHPKRRSDSPIIGLISLHPQTFCAALFLFKLRPPSQHRDSSATPPRTEDYCTRLFSLISRLPFLTKPSPPSSNDFIRAYPLTT